MVEGLMKNKKREGSKKFLKLVSRISEEEKLTKMIERTLKQGKSAAALEGSDFDGGNVQNEQYHACIEKKARIKNDQHPLKSNFLSERCKVTDSLFKKYFMSKFKDQL